MAKTKKRANAKGAAKKPAPVNKAQAKNKGLRAPVKGKQRMATRSVGSSDPKLAQLAASSLSAVNFSASARPNVEEQFEAEHASNAAKAFVRQGWDSIAEKSVSAGVRKRFRFRDAISRLFVRMRDALRRKRTTVREHVD